MCHIHISVFCLTNLFSKSLHKEHLKFLYVCINYILDILKIVTTMTHTCNILGDDSTIQLSKSTPKLEKEVLCYTILKNTR